MPFKWNDKWDKTLDWSHIDFINMFIDAVNERLIAWLGPGNVYLISHISAGQNLFGSSGGIIRLLGDRINQLANGTDIWTIQEPTIDPVNYVGIFATNYMLFLRLKLANFLLNAASDPVNLTNTTGNWRRKKEREIVNLTLGADTNGNSIANGHRARLSFKSPPTTPGELGRVYLRESGAWVVGWQGGEIAVHLVGVIGLHIDRGRRQFGANGR